MDIGSLIVITSPEDENFMDIGEIIDLEFKDNFAITYTIRFKNKTREISANYLYRNYKMLKTDEDYF